MLSIGQLAAYTGVTVAAVRHYHGIGLLPEPERDRSGYRSYDAGAVVRLIRIHALGSAGVPLAQVEGLLDAEPEEFAAEVRGIEARLRGLGVSEHYIERDAWIMVAAQLPDRIDAMMEAKHRDLDDPDIVRLYELFSQALGFTPDDPRVVEAADILDRVLTRAAERGELNVEGFDDPFIDLMDTTMAESGPAATRLLELLAERGWKGWTRFERTDDGR